MDWQRGDALQASVRGQSDELVRLARVTLGRLGDCRTPRRGQGRCYTQESGKRNGVVRKVAKSAWQTLRQNATQMSTWKMRGHTGTHRRRQRAQQQRHHPSHRHRRRVSWQSAWKPSQKQKVPRERQLVTERNAHQTPKGAVAVSLCLCQQVAMRASVLFGAYVVFTLVSGAAQVR